MTSPLLFEAVSRYADAHARQPGVLPTPIPGMTLVRATEPSGLLHAISHPLICLVLQGSKQVTMGPQTFEFTVGESLLITADVPTVSQITRASAAAPYLSIALELSLPVIADLSAQMGAAPLGDHAPVRVDPTDAEVADVALRLMRLLERPEAVPLLHAPWCASCTTGCWPAATAPPSAAWAGPVATPSAWPALWPCCAPISPSPCRWKAWPRWRT